MPLADVATPPPTPAMPAVVPAINPQDFATKFFADGGLNPQVPPPAPVAPAIPPAAKTPAAAPAPAPAPAPVAPKADAPPASDAPPPEKKAPSIFDKTPKKDSAKTPAAPADPFAGIEPPANLSEQGVKDWKTFREKAAGELAKAQKEIADRDARLATYQTAAPAENAESIRLKENYQKAIDRLAILDVQSDPRHVERFVAPRNAALQEVADVLSFTDKKMPDLGVMMAKSPKDFNASVAELTKDLNSMDATVVQTNMRNAYKLAQAEQQALAKPAELQQQMRERQAAIQKKAFDESFQELGIGDGMFGALEIPDDASPEDRAEFESINSTFAAVRPTAEKYAFAAAGPKELARISQKAALHDVYMNTVIPRMDKEHRFALAELAKAKKELDAIKAAKHPGNFSGDPSRGTVSPTVQQPGENPEQFAKRFFSQG